MIHPDTEIRFISEAIGYGVVAIRRIPKGSITWCLDPLDQIISPQQASQLPALSRDILDKYAFRDKHGNHVLCWDNSRFVNHSFQPNCLPTPYDMELAVRDIDVGEELTDHYGALNINEPFRALPEPGIRRRVVYPDDIRRHHRTWDRLLRQAFRDFDHVQQPLLPYMTPEYRQRVQQVSAGGRTMDSCLDTWFRENLAMPTAPADTGVAAPAAQPGNVAEAEMALA